MPVRKAHAVWTGNLQNGHGKMELPSANINLDYSAGSRFENDTGSNPEELLGAAHAGCFSMAFAHALKGAGYEPETVDTNASVTIEKKDSGFTITKIVLETNAKVADISRDEFDKIANDAKENCPVSKALSVQPIELHATLEQ